MEIQRHYSLGLDVGEFNRIPTLSHTGEVIGLHFLQYCLPNAVTELSSF